MTGQTNHSAGPRRTTWTHIAFAVRDIDASIAWYEKFTHLRLLARGEDKDGKNAWLGDPAQSDKLHAAIADLVARSLSSTLSDMHLAEVH